MRYFEKISFEQFKKDIIDDKELYNSYSLPRRDTKYAAGYDIYSLEDFILKPTETIKIPTGIKIISKTLTKNCKELIIAKNLISPLFKGYINPIHIIEGANPKSHSTHGLTSSYFKYTFSTNITYFYQYHSN
jgi:hypothetical protein